MVTLIFLVYILQGVNILNDALRTQYRVILMLTRVDVYYTADRHYTLHINKRNFIFRNTTLS